MLLLTLLAGASAAILGSTWSSTLDDRIVSETLAYHHGDVPLTSFVTYAASWNNEGANLRPVVLIVPDNNGLNEYEMLRATAIVEQWGFVAVGVDVFDNNAQPEAAARGNATAPFTGNAEFFAARIEAAASVAKQLPYVDAKRLAVIGYCFGGSGVLNYVTTGRAAAAAVAFHPGLRYAAPAAGANLTVPLLVLTGGNDTDVANVLQLESTLMNASASVEIQRFGQIRHAFTVWGGAQYDAFVDEKSWASAGTFLRALLGDSSFAADAAAQRCGPLTERAEIGKDANGCCDRCESRVDCSAVLCAAVACERNETAYTPRGQCCPMCRAPCDKSACPVKACAANRRLFVADGECCGTCKPQCEFAGYSCPIAAPVLSGLEAATVGVMSKRIHYADGKTNLTGVLFYQIGWSSRDAKRPLIVVAHDFDGISANELARGEMIAEQGYYAFLADVYGDELTTNGARKSLNQWIEVLVPMLNDPVGYNMRLLKAVAVATAQPGVDATRVAFVGYCFGGTGVLNLAFNDQTAAAVKAANVKGVYSFHGGLTMRSNGTSPIRMQVVVFSGGMDDAVADIVRLENELVARGAPQYELTRYSEAMHAFTTFNVASYLPRADSRSWQSTLANLRRLFGAAPRGSPMPRALIAPAGLLAANNVTTLAAVEQFAKDYAREALFVDSRDKSLIEAAFRSIIQGCQTATQVTGSFRKCYIEVAQIFDELKFELAKRHGGHLHHRGDESSSDSSSSSSSSSSDSSSSSSY